VWGLSFDQAVANGFGMFARYSNQDGDIEENSIKTTWSVGALIEGGAWSRGDDAIGIGYGSVNINDKSLEFAGDPNAADETHLEVFYRYTFSEKFALTPDIQVIGNNGGNETSDTVTVYGIRSQVDF
jgi:carbohydrate-selective porin OprB